MKELDRAIIKTLAYADLFGQAMTVEELHRHLLGKSVKIGEFRSALEKSHISNVASRDGVYFLDGSSFNVDHKFQQQQVVKQKLDTTHRFVWVFKLIPWVKLVCVTGSVAGGTPRVDDDIDLLIVTSNKRLWLSRVCLTALLNLIGKRRKPNDDPSRVNNKLCLNMWLSEDRLTTEDQNVYVANELAHMVPVVNRNKLYERYLVANEWVRDVLPNFYDGSRARLSGRQVSGLGSGHENPRPSALAGILDWLDSRLVVWQLSNCHLEMCTQPSVTLETPRLD